MSKHYMYDCAFCCNYIHSSVIIFFCFKVAWPSLNKKSFLQHCLKILKDDLFAAGRSRCVWRHSGRARLFLPDGTESVVVFGVTTVTSHIGDAALSLCRYFIHFILESWRSHSPSCWFSRGSGCAGVFSPQSVCVFSPAPPRLGSIL